MPVTFHPHKPVDLLEKFITKEDGTPLYGEIDIYRKLHTELGRSQTEWHVWHDLKLPTHSDLFNTYHKDSCQIDFLILSKAGILVLEVKGGAISVNENIFYYGKTFQENNRIPQDPFRQAEGYKYTVKDKILNNLGKCLICYGVAFPHVDYTMESKVYDSNILWSKYRSGIYNNSVEKFLISVFEYNRTQHKKHLREYPEVSLKEVDAIKRTLSPLYTDKSRYESSNTLEWLNVSNLEILEGLYKNSRIMIEGPPGCGKTTIAKAFIDNQIGKRGLYLCWNNFLMHFTKKMLIDRKGSDEIEVTTMSRFINALGGFSEPQNMFNMTEDQFYEAVKHVLDKLENENSLPVYDYIVIDEGQDIFDRGMDLMVNKLCGYNRHGLTNGTALVLYDIDQSYSGSGRNVLEISDLLTEYFTHFKLNEIRRSAQCPDIKMLCSSIFQRPALLLDFEKRQASSNICVTRHKDLENVKRHIVTKILGPMRDANSSLRGGGCVLLAESVFLKDSYGNGPGLKYWLTIKDVEEMDAENVSDSSNKLRYTSILKFKGLEKENVFLVVREPSELNKYELYVGITRAIYNIEVMIVE